MHEVNQRMFNKVLQAFGDDVVVGSGELYGAALMFIDQGSPELARAILGHAYDMHEEDNSYINGEHTEAEVFLETFRRAFYDDSTAALHGTLFIAQNPMRLGGITAFLLSRALGPEPVEEDNVVYLNGSKSLN